MNKNWTTLQTWNTNKTNSKQNNNDKDHDDDDDDDDDDGGGGDATPWQKTKLLYF